MSFIQKMEMATLSGASMNEAAVDNGAVYVEGLGTQLTPHKVVPPGEQCVCVKHSAHTCLISYCGRILVSGDQSLIAHS